MKHAEVDDRLEVIIPEGMEAAAPNVTPTTGQRFRITAKHLGLVAGLVVAGALFAAYAGFAVAGVRSLERLRDEASLVTAEREAISRRLLAAVVTDEDTAIVAQATRDLLLEHRDRSLALARRAQRVRAVDPGVRNLRRAMFEAFMRDAHDLEHAAEAPVPPAAPALGRGYPYADRVLDQELRQWRLDPGEVPADPPHLRAADLALVRLATWSDVKTGVRLLVNSPAGLRFLDLDESTVAAVDMDGVGDVAAGPDLVAAVTDGGVVLLDPYDVFVRRRAQLPQGFEPRSLVLSTRGGVWVQEAPGRPVVEVDQAGQPTGAQSPAHGELVADVGPNLLWAVREPEADRRGLFLGDYVLSDKNTGAVVTRWPRRELLEASEHGMAWRVGSQSLEVTDPGGKGRPVPTRPDLFPRSADFAVDGRLAVAWGDGRLDIIDAGGVVASVSTGGPAVLRWTPSGKHVFFSMGTGLAWYTPGEDAVHAMRIRDSAGFLVAAF